MVSIALKNKNEYNNKWTWVESFVNTFQFGESKAVYLRHENVWDGVDSKEQPAEH